MKMGQTQKTKRRKIQDEDKRWKRELGRSQKQDENVNVISQ